MVSTSALQFETENGGTQRGEEKEVGEEEGLRNQRREKTAMTSVIGQKCRENGETANENERIEILERKRRLDKWMKGGKLVIK